MAARAWRVAGLALVLLGSTGCVSGALYSHVTVPLDVNLNRTPVVQAEAKDASHIFQYYVRVDWGTNGLGDIAKQHGFKKIHYADLETLSVLGFWTQYTAHVYGER